MTDPEDSAAKNEQELNLFSDRLVPEPPPVEPESGEPAVSGEVPVEDNTAIQDIPAEESAEQPVPEMGVPPDDSPVVAPPPPPSRQPSPARPGIVSPRAGRAAFPPPSASAATVRTHKPLPHALQSAQTLGQMLTAIRNARGMSPEEVAAHTRIRLEYITELESDELLENLPPVYVSAYVRKLIEVYDLPKADSDVLLDKLREETPQDSEELSDKLLESRYSERF